MCTTREASSATHGVARLIEAPLHVMAAVPKTPVPVPLVLPRNRCSSEVSFSSMAELQTEGTDAQAMLDFERPGIGALFRPFSPGRFLPERIGNELGAIVTEPDESTHHSSS